MQTVPKRENKRMFYWLVLSVMLARMAVSRTASDEVDCRAAVKSGYVSGDTVPDTCTVQLTLNDTETDIIDSLRENYQDFPLRCRLGRYFKFLLSTFSKSDSRFFAARFK